MSGDSFRRRIEKGETKMKAKIDGIEVEGTPKEIAEFAIIRKGRYGRKFACDCGDWIKGSPNRYCSKCYGCGYYYED